MGLDITGLGSVFDFGSKVIDKIFPNKDDAEKAKLAMLQMAQNGEFKELDLQAQRDQQQAAINAEEATKGGLLNQWRPALGWVCVSAYAYNFVLMPFVVWLATFITGAAPAMSAMDTTELSVLLLGMLGIGGMRSIDKKTATRCK
jgi:hypothetical protein